MSNEKVTLAAAAVPYPGLQGELVVSVEENVQLILLFQWKADRRPLNHTRNEAVASF